MATKPADARDARPGTEWRADHQDGGRAAAKRMVEAVAAKDYMGVFGALAPDTRFRYLVPRGPGELVGAADVAAKYFEWFGDADVITVEGIHVESLADRMSARYRFLLHKRDGWKVIQQQEYLDVNREGRIASVDLLCSGFRPVRDKEAAESSGTHRFDAGNLGCPDGLASEFRRRIGAIPIGDVLVVTARDPAAKEDLPPLARMMGHAVLSIDSPGDGRLLITVERRR